MSLVTKIISGQKTVNFQKNLQQDKVEQSFFVGKIEEELSEMKNKYSGLSIKLSPIKSFLASRFPEDQWQSMCSENKLQQPIIMVLLFLSRELLSSDISGNKNADPTLLNFLKQECH